MQTQDSLSHVFFALADPTRRAIISQLSSGNASVSELAKPFMNDMSLPAVTKHLKVLEKAGLITKTRDAQWRQCKLHQAGFKEVADWMEDYRTFWEESFDRLDAHLRTVMLAKKADAQAKTKSKSKSKSKGKRNADNKK